MMLAETIRVCFYEGLHLAQHWHARPHTRAHHYGVKVMTTVLVLIALLAPEGARLPLAVAANCIWIWIDP